MKTEDNRDNQELLVDYAKALRDGSIPVFLQSLTRAEAEKLTCSITFWSGIEVVRAVTAAAFADKIITPNVDLFISRVNARMASRSKNAAAPSIAKRVRSKNARHIDAELNS